MKLSPEDQHLIRLALLAACEKHEGFLKQLNEALATAMPKDSGYERASELARVLGERNDAWMELYVRFNNELPRPALRTLADGAPHPTAKGVFWNAAEKRYVTAKRKIASNTAVALSELCGALNAARKSATMDNLDVLRAKLLAYERTGDHDHDNGKGPVGVGEPCPGGDCIVHEVRTFLYR